MTDRAPTKRQLVALDALYHGRSIFDRTGMGDGRRWTSNAGGAVGIMRERMGEAGWLECKYSRSGRMHYSDKLTTSGLKVLAAGRPDLDLADAIAASEQADKIAAAIAAVEADNAAKARAERAKERRIERAAAMRDIAQSYQISLDALTDDQCVDMWMAVVGREMRID